MESGRSDFLRPEFTSRITDQLLAGESINLISPHGQGRRRTLHDLRQNLPPSLQVFHMNMRTYKVNYKGFYNDLSAQIKHHSAFDKNFKTLLNNIEKQHEKSLLILHNFDDLRADNDISIGYDQHFFQALNSIQQRCTMALLCVSTAPHDHYRLHADGSENKHAHINARPIALPRLSQQQLIAELQRRDPSQTEDELHVLSANLLLQAASYSALNKLLSEHTAHT